MKKPHNSDEWSDGTRLQRHQPVVSGCASLWEGLSRVKLAFVTLQYTSTMKTRSDQFSPSWMSTAWSPSKRYG